MTYTPTGEERIFINALEGGAEIQLTPVDFQGFAFQPRWSPNAEAIAYFVGEPDSMTYSLWLQSVDGGEPISFGDFESIMSPGWTPDARLFIFGAGQHPEYEIIAVDMLDGTVMSLSEGSFPTLAAGG